MYSDLIDYLKGVQRKASDHVNHFLGRHPDAYGYAGIGIFVFLCIQVFQFQNKVLTWLSGSDVKQIVILYWLIFGAALTVVLSIIAYKFSGGFSSFFQRNKDFISLCLLLVSFIGGLFAYTAGIVRSNNVALARILTANYDNSMLVDRMRTETTRENLIWYEFFDVDSYEMNSDFIGKNFSNECSSLYGALMRRLSVVNKQQVHLNELNEAGVSKGNLFSVREENLKSIKILLLIINWRCITLHFD